MQKKEKKRKKEKNIVMEEATAQRRGRRCRHVDKSIQGNAGVGGTRDYKLATLCRGYWRAKLRTTIHPFFEPGTHFLASSRFPGRSPPRLFFLDADNRLTT